MKKRSQEEYRKNGEICVLRGIYEDRVWSAQSVIVIQDNPKETILLLTPGAQCAFPEGYWNWKLKKDFSNGTRWQEAKQLPIVHREFAWNTNRILVFLEPQKYFSCFLFWDQASDQFLCYYINFQLPYQRSHCGFDTLDLDLDIVIDPQYNWRWKDEEDFQNGIHEGGIKKEWVVGIEQSKGEVIDRIKTRKYPVDSSWLDWRPNQNWDPPSLPENWQVI